MVLANQEIRVAAKKYNVPLWRIAQEIGVSEATFTRKMRVELLEDERREFLTIIEELARVEV